MQTESDWESYLDNGIFDYNSYQIYRELVEGISVADTTGYLLTALGNPQSDFIAPATAADDSVMPYRPSEWSRQFRSGQKVQEGRNTGYLLLSSSNDQINFEYKGRNDNNSWETERRSVFVRWEKYDLAVGNYTADIGSGLGIGRYDYRPLGISGDSMNSDILFPDNSYYNGAKLEINRRFTLVFSSKKYLSTQKTFLGGAAWAMVDNYKVGITAAATNLSSGNNRRSLGEGSIYIANSELGLKSEFGYAESGAGIVCEFSRQNYDVRFWHYDDSFINLQCSGMAYPDYQSFADVRFPVTFRQPQAGESGISLRRNFMIGNLYLIALSSAWKRSPIEPVSLDNTFGVRYSLGKSLALNARYSERSGRLPGRTLTEMGFDLGGRLRAAGLVSLRHDGQGNNSSISFAQLFVSIPVKSAFLANARIRSHFDGALEYFVEERTVIADRLILKATYRWMESMGHESGPLYLVTEASF